MFLISVRKKRALPVKVPAEIVNRYSAMLLGIEAEEQPDPGTSLSHLKWMIGELTKDRPWGKQRGWIGFIQYGLISRGYTSVQAERDFTRPFFNELDNIKE